VGLSGLEICIYPEGVIGKPSLASPEKAYAGVERILDYLVELHDDILGTFPPGELPPMEKVSQRPKEEIDAVVRGPPYPP